MSPRSFARLSTPLLLASGLFTTQAHAQNQPGSLLGLVQVITSPALGVNVANDQGQPALVRAGALPVGAQPSLNVSAIQVAPVDVLPLNSTATTTPILPGVLSVSTGLGLGINLLADEPGPAVVDVGLLPLGDGAAQNFQQFQVALEDGAAADQHFPVQGQHHRVHGQGGEGDGQHHEGHGRQPQQQLRSDQGSQVDPPDPGLVVDLIGDRSGPPAPGM